LLISLFSAIIDRARTIILHKMVFLMFLNNLQVL
jgi:hypothetical protein